MSGANKETNLIIYTLNQIQSNKI